MTIFECDFCQKQKPCRKLTVDQKEYDICKSCEKKLSLKLEGRGTPKLMNYNRIVYQPWQYWYIVPTYTVPVNPPVIQTPTITCGGEGNYVGNSGNSVSYSGSSTYLLSGAQTQ